jgi:hypothetical protein
MTLLPNLNFEFYQRRSSRERVLLVLVVGAVFVLANLIAVHVLMTNFRDLIQLRADRAQEAEVSALYVKEQPMWMKRADWVRATQPKLLNRDVEGVNLEAQIKDVADRNRVILLNHQIQPPAVNQGEKNTDYQPLTVQTDVKGDWASMVRFISALQQPEKFVVFESATLRIDRDDPKMIKGEFHIAKWYAPAGK